VPKEPRRAVSGLQHAAVVVAVAAAVGAQTFAIASLQTASQPAALAVYLAPMVVSLAVWPQMRQAWRRWPAVIGIGVASAGGALGPAAFVVSSTWVWQRTWFESRTGRQARR